MGLELLVEDHDGCLQSIIFDLELASLATLANLVRQGPLICVGTLPGCLTPHLIELFVNIPGIAQFWFR